MPQQALAHAGQRGDNPQSSWETGSLPWSAPLSVFLEAQSEIRLQSRVPSSYSVYPCPITSQFLATPFSIPFPSLRTFSKLQLAMRLLTADTGQWGAGAESWVLPSGALLVSYFISIIISSMVCTLQINVSSSWTRRSSCDSGFEVSSCFVLFSSCSKINTTSNNCREQFHCYPLCSNAAMFLLGI